MSLVNALKSPLSTVFGIFSPGATSKFPSPNTLQLSNEQQKLVSPEGAPLSEKADFRIEGMTCGACVEVSHIPQSQVEVLVLPLRILLAHRWPCGSPGLPSGGACSCAIGLPSHNVWPNVCPKDTHIFEMNIE
jgi:hypothetical protein